MPETPKENKRDVVMSFSPASLNTGGTSWFFGIGINQYSHFTNLYNAVKDVQDLVGLLQQQYDIAEEQTLTLYNEKATRKNIIKMLDRLQREVGPSDKLIIYYSGHGHLNKNTNKGYWIPTDAEHDNTSEYIRNSTIREYIETLKSLHTLLISDSCFSGSLFVRGASRSTAAVNELATIPSRWAICSGRHDEEVFDGEPGANSPFAESIMETLRRNQKKEINVARLVDRVIDQTRSNYKQLPEGNPLYGVGHKGGQYIFNRRADEGEDWAQAKAAETLAGYRQFLENHPSGKHAEQAQKNIATLEEEAAWEKAKTEHTVLAYYEYDQAYPNGRYHRDALNAITELEEETAWQEAERRNMLSGYRKYTSDYPRGKYRTEADARISAIISSKQEPALWKQTTLRDTTEAYTAYLKKYPEGVYAEEAQHRLSELEQAIAKKEKTNTKQQATEQKQAQKAAAPATSPPKQGVKQPVQATASRTSSPQPKKPVEAKSSLPKWLPMAAGGLVLLLVVGWGISQMSDSSSTRENTSTTTAERGSYTGKTVKLNGLTWMAENLNAKTADSWCYEDDPANCNQYGRLYTWEAAKKACASLGSGWRMPVDAEWKSLAQSFGGYEEFKQDIGDPKKAYTSLLRGGSSGLSAQLGGSRISDGRFGFLGLLGNYWSATKKDSGQAWYYYFSRDHGKLIRHISNTTIGIGRSCRCVQD